jgi:hypothetical protein
VPIHPFYLQKSPIFPEYLRIAKVASGPASTDRAVVAAAGLMLVGMPLQIVDPLAGNPASRPEADVPFRNLEEASSIRSALKP